MYFKVRLVQVSCNNIEGPAVGFPITNNMHIVKLLFYL